MAVIGKIRQHSILLIVVIGVALAAFVLGDLFQGGGRAPERNIGKVNGEDINIMEFNRRFEENADATRQQMQSERLSQDDLFRIRENTWNQLLQDIILGEQFDRLGLTVTTAELFDQVQGPDPHPAIIQNFTNPETGQYDRSGVLEYLQNLDNMPLDARRQWLIFERYIKEDRLTTKYNNLITKAYYTPTQLARKAWQERNHKADFELVGVRFMQVHDSLIEVTDQDYRDFYEKNKHNYFRQAGRDIEYVVFDILPSDQDEQGAQEYIRGLEAEFRATENIAAFVNANSDQRYNDNWLSREEVPVVLEDIMFNAEPGHVHGPYMEDGAYHLARLVNVAQRPDSLKASHVLISYQGAMRSEQMRSKTEAEQIADSLLRIIQARPAQINQIAAELSDDGSAPQNSGDLGWFTDGQMVPAFNNFVMDNPVGTVGMVESDFGYHIIRVTDKTEPRKKIKLALLTHEVTPSSQTYQRVFAKVSRFASEARTRAQFDEVIERDGLSKRIAPSLTKSTNNIPGIQMPRQIVRWAFDRSTRENDVSTIFDMDDKYVVAVLTKKWDEGIPSLADMRDNIETQVTNNKKGRHLAQRMESIGSDLAEVAAAFGVEVESLEQHSFYERSIPNYGMENKLSGAMFSLNEGETAGPVVGNMATYLATMTQMTMAEDAENYENIRRDQRNLFTNSVRNNGVYRVLEKLADVEDNRLLFY